MSDEMTLPKRGRWCVIDCNGEKVFCRDLVIASDGETYRVCGFQLIDENHAWIITRDEQLLIPHLCEKVVK